MHVFVVAWRIDSVRRLRCLGPDLNSSRLAAPAIPLGCPRILSVEQRWDFGLRPFTAPPSPGHSFLAFLPALLEFAPWSALPRGDPVVRSNLANWLMTVMGGACCFLIVVVQLWPSPRLEALFSLSAAVTLVGIAVFLQCDWLIAGHARVPLVATYAVLHFASGLYSAAASHAGVQTENTTRCFLAAYLVIMVLLAFWARREVSPPGHFRKAVSIPVPALFIYLAMQNDVLRSSWLYGAIASGIGVVAVNRVLDSMEGGGDGNQKP